MIFTEPFRRVFKGPVNAHHEHTGRLMLGALVNKMRLSNQSVGVFNRVIDGVTYRVVTTGTVHQMQINAFGDTGGRRVYGQDVYRRYLERISASTLNVMLYAVNEEAVADQVLLKMFQSETLILNEVAFVHVRFHVFTRQHYFNDNPEDAVAGWAFNVPLDDLVSGDFEFTRDHIYRTGTNFLGQTITRFMGDRDTIEPVADTYWGRLSEVQVFIDILAQFAGPINGATTPLYKDGNKVEGNDQMILIYGGFGEALHETFGDKGTWDRIVPAMEAAKCHAMYWYSIQGFFTSGDSGGWVWSNRDLHLDTLTTYLARYKVYANWFGSLGIYDADGEINEEGLKEVERAALEDLLDVMQNGYGEPGDAYSVPSLGGILIGRAMALSLPKTLIAETIIPWERPATD